METEERNGTSETGKEEAGERKSPDWTGPDVVVTEDDGEY